MSFLRKLRMIRLLIFGGIFVFAMMSRAYVTASKDFTAWLHPAAPTQVAASPSPALAAPAAPTTPAAPVATSTVTTTADASASATPVSSATDATSPSTTEDAAPAWTAPAVIPVVPGGTLTTPTAIYTNARIVNVEADRVTIMHDGGRAVIPTWQLPESLQEQLNYSPKVALAAESEHARTEPLAQPAATQVAFYVPPTGPAPVAAPVDTTDYKAALASAKSSGKLILLHFTGSDWCPYCKMLDDEVLSKSNFNQFAASNYIIVTVDFPHDTPQPDDLKQQNASLAQKYGVDGYPTLLVIDKNEKERGRISGYQPGSGPDAVIGRLQNFNHPN